MAKSGAQIWLEYAIVASAVRTLGLLPLRVAAAIGVGLGSFVYHFLGRHRSIAMRNLEIAFPDKSVIERAEILKNAFRNMGRVAGYFSQFGKLNYENMHTVVEYDPDPEFDSAMKKVVEAKRGRIFLTGHTGNWELQALSFPLFFGPLSFLARRMDNPKIEDIVLKTRTRLGNAQIDKENSAGSILRLMRRGGSVGVLADVNAHPNEGVFVPFFGIPASTSTGICLLAQRSNAVIVPMLAIWDEKKRKYILRYRDIIEPINTGNREEDIREMTAMCAAATESMIREFPDQYIWIHRRWKTRPPGEPELY